MFLLLGALLGILAGLLLILKPQLVHATNRAASHWISTRRLNLILDRSINIEHWFYRHHRLTGTVAVLGAAYLFTFFGLLFDKTSAVQRTGAYLPFKLQEGLLDALVLGSLAGAAVALLAGLFLWLRPSLLRGIEADANRWVSTRRVNRVLDMPRDQVDRFVEQHARSMGWLLLLGSFYLFVAMVGWLL
ncbi:MAG TPA: hypothetical protein VFP33_00720 [Gallionella sp.]|nr:hypothetical protein [Gallionella sp.]